MAKMLDLSAMAVVGLLYVSVGLRWGFSWRRTGRGLSFVVFIGVIVHRYDFPPVSSGPGLWEGR